MCVVTDCAHTMQVLIEITDFGLSKDKSFDTPAHRREMTGCGSSLWMAPEIRNGVVFNEKVDAYR